MSVKRYDVMACIDTPAHRWHSVVLAADYDLLAQRCERLEKALEKNRHDFRAGEELMKRITDNATLGERIAFNDLELANRWRMRVRLMLEDAKLALAASGKPDEGITDSRCTYLWFKDLVCNKCGRVHDGKPDEGGGM
jgi:HPt (histidine-containing phosphotransfer) domain-containing protein